LSGLRSAVMLIFLTPSSPRSSRFAVTAEDQAQAREALLALLASETNLETARRLADAVAGLSPTVADLHDSDTWPFPPTPSLLAAAR
jgi:hypothetical protein